MIRSLLSTFFLLFVLPSYGQNNGNKDSLQVNSTSIKVTLLGTGDPQPIMERFGPSILVQAGVEVLLFDAGRGCLQRLQQINLSYDRINALFLTHLHSDHIVGLPDLWLTGWLISKRSVPLTVFGPKGTKEMIMYLQQAFSFDINIRIEDDKAPKDGSRLSVTEIQQGTVYEKNGVKVIAFEVDHGPVKPSFGYRIEYNGHSVVLSGDTRYSENLIKYARGTDLLIHEVVIAPDTLNKSDPKYAIFAHHTSPEQVCKVFNEVKPKLAVYSHIVKLYGRNENELIKRTRANYSGLVMIGEDLMSFTIDDTVSINEWRNKKKEQ
ncbi:MAG TPA: MBL fold metallo-hydrolase [Bacteroidales bacterium]|nr:MBL fold metallo-hydrolase [Bacteroidales bacterium]